MQKLIILTLTLVSVLAKSDQDEANSHFFEGFFLGNILGNNNQIGGDGSKPGFCPSSNANYQPGGSSHSRGKRSPQPQWWSSNSYGSHSYHKPNYNNGGGLNWNNRPGGSSYYPGLNWNRPGGSSYYPGGNQGHHNGHHNNHYGRPGGSSHHRGKRTAEYAPWLKPNYDPGFNWNNPGYATGGNYGHHYGNHNSQGHQNNGNDYYPSRPVGPGGIFGGHYRGKRSPQQLNGGSSSSNSKPDYTNGGGLTWNNHHNNPGGSSHYPGNNHNNPGGSSHYPGNNHHNNGSPGGSSHNRRKRSPETAPWLRPNNSNKPNYRHGGLDWNNDSNTGGFQWNNNNVGQKHSCYSDRECPGRQKCCNRICTQPTFY